MTMDTWKARATEILDDARRLAIPDSLVNEALEELDNEYYREEMIFLAEMGCVWASPYW